MRPAEIDHLLSVMNDQTADVDLRIEAARQILLHCEKTLASLSHPETEPTR